MRIIFLLEKDDWKKVEKNNRTIALNVLYDKKEKIYPAYFSKHNPKQAILLMITNGEGWNYLAVKKLLQLLRGIMYKQHSDFYFLNFLHSFATENKLEFHKNYEKVKIFVMLQCLLKTLKH